MAINPDFRDLLSEFGAGDVRFLIVGGYAVNFHGVHRLTKDLDVWVDPEATNARKVWEALAKFGAPLRDVDAKDLAQPGMVLQIGVVPNRVDIITTTAGIEFADAWKNRVKSTYGGVAVYYIGAGDLVINKRAVGRPRDKQDVRSLERRAQDSKNP